MTVVTGMAGTGKSAALARLVTLSDLGFCAQHPDLIVSADLRPPIGAVGAAVLGTGKFPNDVLGQILEAFTGSRPSAGASLADLRTIWWAWLNTQDDPVTVVLDALDEAQHPATLLTEVLAQLNPPNATAPRVRLIVGIRSPGGPDDSPGGGALADQAEQVLAATRLRVDESPCGRTRSSPATPTACSPASPDRPTCPAGALHPATMLLRGAVAETIGARAGKSFLITRIAATSLAYRAQRTVPEDPHLLATLDDGVLGVFRADLHVSLKPADRKRAVDLLRAVAFAYGAGLPWRQIWPLVANAVIDRPGTYGDGDIAWLLTSRIGAYLVTDQEDGVTVYRPFHDALRTTLRERSRELLDSNP